MKNDSINIQDIVGQYVFKHKQRTAVKKYK